MEEITMTNEEKQIVDTIKNNIKRLGFSQADLADALGVSRPAVSQMFTATIPLRRLYQFAEIIGCSVSELLQDSDHPTKQDAICPHCGKPIQVEIKLS